MERGACHTLTSMPSFSSAQNFFSLSWAARSAKTYSRGVRSVSCVHAAPAAAAQYLRYAVSRIRASSAVLRCHRRPCRVSRYGIVSHGVVPVVPVVPVMSIAACGVVLSRSLCACRVAGGIESVCPHGVQTEKHGQKESKGASALVHQRSTTAQAPHTQSAFAATHTTQRPSEHNEHRVRLAP